jgi:hypothetical protein
LLGRIFAGHRKWAEYQWLRGVTGGSVPDLLRTRVSKKCAFEIYKVDKRKKIGPNFSV